MTMLATRRETATMTSASTAPTTETARSAPLAPTRAGSACYRPALVTGALLWACHFPLGWGFLSWFALVPFLTLIRVQVAPKRLYTAAYVGGLAFFVPALQWMRVADYRMYGTWAMLATYCSVYFPVALALLRMLDRRRMPLTFAVPLVWVGLEWVRSYALTGFAWYYLAHAQHRHDALLQVADVGGVYAVSFLVAAVNGLLLTLALRVPAWRDRFGWQDPTLRRASDLGRKGWAPGLAMQALAVASLAIATVLYGVWRLEQPARGYGPRVALLQGNLDQRIRNEAGAPNAHEAASQSTFEHYARLAYLAAQSPTMPDLVIWPETSYHVRFVDVAADLPTEKTPGELIAEAAFVRNEFRNGLVKLTPTAHLLGLNVRAIASDLTRTSYSSALLVDKTGTPTQRFDKIHRVPFGEYVPLRDWLPFMNAFAPYDYDYSIAPGKSLTRFNLGKYTYGALICYEDTDAALARGFLQDGPDGKPVDFFVNLSNDGWFDGTSEHEEHLIVSRFRAIEFRRPLVRAVNMGISAVIDGNGRVLKPQTRTTHVDPNMKPAHRKGFEGIRVWETALDSPETLGSGDYASFKKQAGVLFARVPLDGRSSLYARWGDWLPWSCWAIVGVAFVVGRLGRRGPALARA